METSANIMDEIIMTDYQFKSVLRLVKKIVRESKTKEEAEMAIAKVIAGEDDEPLEPVTKVNNEK
jgi:hypothetical protein